MTHRKSLFAALIVLGIHLAGCGGSGGQSGGYGPQADCDTGTGNPGSPPAASDHSAMLVGHFHGTMFTGLGDKVWFFEDGTFAWESKADITGDEWNEYSGWLWSVAGADELPDMGAAWVVQFWPGPDATVPKDPYAFSKHVSIVAIDAHGFTTYEVIEHNEMFDTMTRVP